MSNIHRSFSFGQKQGERDNLPVVQNKALPKLNKMKVLLGFATFLVVITKKCSVKGLEMNIFFKSEELKEKSLQTWMDL